MKRKSTQKARELRSNLTEAEKHLWYVLRLENIGVKFRRQAVIGRYIVDFVCFERRLVIEVDGGQHQWDLHDKDRDRWMKEQGFQVLRFWNDEVLVNRDGVLNIIFKYLKSPSLALPARGREVKRRTASCA